MPNPKLQRPAGQQLHRVAVMLTGLVERLADTVSGQLRDDALSGLSAARLIIAAHEKPMPDLVELVRELRNTIVTMDAQITVRANKVADEVILADRAKAAGRYAGLQHQYEADQNRWDDLEREMRRQMFAMERGRAQYANALLDVVDALVTVNAGNETLPDMKGALTAAIAFTRGKAPGRRYDVPDRPDRTSRERRLAEEQRDNTDA